MFQRFCQESGLIGDVEERFVKLHLDSTSFDSQLPDSMKREDDVITCEDCLQQASKLAAQTQLKCRLLDASVSRERVKG